MKHGGDLLSYEDQYQGQLIDFSSNINPLGLVEGLKETIIESFKSIESYPDIKYRRLKASISKYLGCKKENLLVGNGAVEIIDIFTNLANRVVLLTPSFLEYEERALVHKKELIEITYKDDFTIDLDKIEKILQKGDLLILGNPNNPTGLRIEKEKLIEIYNLVKEKDANLLLDEAFFEFAPLDYDSVEVFKDKAYENLGIIRAATKFFAIPGLRLGYGVTSLSIKGEIDKYQMPWTVNALADIAGQYIFDKEEYIKASKDYIEIERNYLLEELSKIKEIIPYKTHSNYMLIKLLKYDEEYIFDLLLKYGIVIRKCASFKTLGKDHIRVAIKDRKSNEILVSSLKNLYERGRF